MMDEKTQQLLDAEVETTKKIWDLVLAEDKLDDDFLRSNSSDLSVYIEKVIHFNQILTGFSYEDCEGFCELAMEGKINDHYQSLIKNADALEKQFNEEGNG
tara:strand:+ start:470 stop:772 length:303 start_codon:yes stop_codon:yes gene_type:complete